jgi:hypothetical protein
MQENNSSSSHPQPEGVLGTASCIEFENSSKKPLCKKTIVHRGASQAFFSSADKQTMLIA